MEKKILIAQPIAASGIEYLRGRGYTLVFPEREDRHEIMSLIRDCEGAISKTFLLDREILECAPALKVIGKHGAGVDNVVNVKDANELGICVCNTPLANCRSVAEHTMGFILALSKNLAQMDRAVREDDFAVTDRMNASSLEGKTLGIIGVGNIGSQVARMAHMGFDMEILAYDPWSRTDEKYITFTDKMEELLEKSDFVSLHLPSSPETYHMIGEVQLQRMKHDACLINCARGQLVDEEALERALRDHVIRAAALDVYDPEPPVPGNPLFLLPNILFSPHSAALSTEAMDAMSYGAALGVDEVLEGKKPTWCVNWNEVRKGRR